MANANAPFGARVIGNFYGAPFGGATRTYIIPETNSTSLNKGDFVAVDGNGAVGPHGQTYPTITQATEGGILTGIVIGFPVDADSLAYTYRLPNTKRLVLVADHVYTVFEIQTNGIASTSNFGANADIILGTPGNFGISGTQLNQATVTPSTAQLRILGLGQALNNEIGQYATLICMMNEQFYKQTAGI